MNQKYVSAFSLLALAILTGCTQGNAPAPATEATPAVAEPAPAPEPVAAPIPAKGANGLLTATPGSAGCDAGIEVNVAWDIGTTPAVSEVDLLVSKDLLDMLRLTDSRFTRKPMGEIALLGKKNPIGLWTVERAGTTTRVPAFPAAQMQ